MVKSYLEPEEISQMEQAATNLRDRLLIRLLLHLGCRVSEALGVTVEDIDLSKGTVTIQHLKTRLQLGCSNCSAMLSKSSIYCPKCGVKVDKVVAEEKAHRRLRTLPIDRDTHEMLKEYIRLGGPVVRNGRRLIFGINRHRAWQIVKQCAEIARLPRLINPETGKIHNISPHKLRDCFAILAMKKDDSGDGLRMLQEHLGHQSFNTTAKYRKISGHEHRDWYDQLWKADKP